MEELQVQQERNQRRSRSTSVSFFSPKTTYQAILESKETKHHSSPPAPSEELSPLLAPLSTPEDVIIPIAESKMRHIPGYAIVYVWHSKCAICACWSSCCCFRGKRKGHASMQLVEESGARIRGGYISLWPHPSEDSSYVPNLAADMKNEEGPPSALYKVFNVDVAAVYQEFKSLQASAKVKWHISGSGFFKAANTSNCSGLVLNLLLKHTRLVNVIEALPSPDRGCHSTENMQYSNLKDILSVTRSPGSYRSGSWRVAKASCLVTISMFFLLCSIGYIFNEIKAILFISGYSNRHDLGKWIVLLIVAFILIVRVGYACWAATQFPELGAAGSDAVNSLTISVQACKTAWSTIANCGGISPDDVGFLLSYLSKKNTYYCHELREGEVGYRIADREVVVEEVEKSPILTL